MANVEGAYCAVSDMRTGDIATPSYTTPEQYVKNAAEEIDAALGHIYVTPFEIEEVPANRPSILFLKKINYLLASGRCVLDAAAVGEQTELHAYGNSMLKEAQGMLALLTKTKDALVLVGAETLSDDDQKGDTGPMIHNEDAESLVEAGYRRFGYRALPLGFPQGPVRPYGY